MVIVSLFTLYRSNAQLSEEQRRDKVSLISWNNNIEKGQQNLDTDTSIDGVESPKNRGSNWALNEYPYILLRNVDEFPFDLDKDGDIPLFWHIHKSGGSSMKHIFTCMRKIQTRRIENPAIGCSDKDPMFKVCSIPFGSENLGSRIINVDASSEVGISRAIDLGLTERGRIQGLPKIQSAPDMNGADKEETFIEWSKEMLEEERKEKEGKE